MEGGPRDLSRVWLATSILGLASGGVLWFLDQPDAANVVWIITTVLALASLLRDVVIGLLRRQPGVDVIALLAMGGSLALEEYLAGAVIALMLASGEALESYADRRAHRELSALLDRAPRVVARYEDGELVERPVDAVRRGDRLLVKPGAVIPVDGIASTHAVLDESALTGESRPVERPAGDPIRSGRRQRRRRVRPAGDDHGRREHVRRDRAARAGIRAAAGSDRPARRPVRRGVRPHHAGGRRRGLGDGRRGPGAVGPRRGHAVSAPARGADRDRVGDLPRRASGHHREGWRRPGDARAREGPRAGQDRHAHVGDPRGGRHRGVPGIRCDRPCSRRPRPGRRASPRRFPRPGLAARARDRARAGRASPRPRALLPHGRGGASRIGDRGHGRRPPRGAREVELRVRGRADAGPRP